jgi:hypothetical protein
MDLSALKSSVSAALAAEPAKSGRPPSNIQVLVGKLNAHPDLTGFDRKALSILAGSCGFGNASADGAVYVYVKQIKNYMMLQQSSLKASAEFLRQKVLAMEAEPLPPKKVSRCLTVPHATRCPLLSVVCLAAEG